MTCIPQWSNELHSVYKKCCSGLLLMIKQLVIWQKLSVEKQAASAKTQAHRPYSQPNEVQHVTLWRLHMLWCTWLPQTLWSYTGMDIICCYHFVSACEIAKFNLCKKLLLRILQCFAKVKLHEINTNMVFGFLLPPSLSPQSYSCAYILSYRWRGQGHDSPTVQRLPPQVHQDFIHPDRSSTWWYRNSDHQKQRRTYDSKNIQRECFAVDDRVWQFVPALEDWTGFSVVGTQYWYRQN